MSIRLRLTLLYTAILALTLTAFSAILYGTQLQSILTGEKQMLAGVAHRFAERRLDDHPFEEPPFPPLPPREEVAPNRRFGVNIYVQLLSLEGQVINRSENLEEVGLPLSDAGWQAVQSGEPWAETASVEGERLLIYSTSVLVDGQATGVVQVARSFADQHQYLGTMRRNLLIGSGVATIVAFGAGWVLSGVVLRPVNRITQTARAIGAERDFGRRVDHTGPNDEIGQLATTFNRMLTQLQAAYQQVERSLQQQRQFVADVSHELRTPLTTIRGNLALLRREPAIGAEEETDILEDIAGESDRLIRLVNDLLTLAHAESGRQLQSETVWVKPLVEDVCRQARLLDPDRTITCARLLDVGVVGDQDALKQVLLILMDNALKHSTGAITVTTAHLGPKGLGDPSGLNVAISIHDTGPGIDPSALPHVFERFYRGDEARGRPGIGLGLPIAKALVEAQHGTITAESLVGQGSVITVTLPRAVTHREDPEATQR
jgi:two-component system OmpR family sensor kinase